MFAFNVLTGRISRLLCVRRSRSTISFRDVPEPKGLPLIGTVWEYLVPGAAETLHERVGRNHAQLGPIYKEKLGPITCVFVADADAINEVFRREGKFPAHIIPEAWRVCNERSGRSRGLLFMDGPEWWEQRKTLNKILLKGDLKWMETSCDFIIDNFVETLKDSRVAENFESELYMTFLEILVCVLVGSRGYVQNQNLVKGYVKKATTHVRSIFEKTVKLQNFPVSLAIKLGLSRWKQFEATMTEALNETNDFVDDLLENLEDGGGLLGKMLSEKVDKEPIKAIVADLILAAADTTCYTMLWMLYLLGTNVDKQEYLRLEIADPNSKYPSYVLRETLRLYPVAPFITRFNPEDIVLLHHKIPKHSLIIMSIITTGRDENYFLRAKEFLPERWERKDNKLLMANVKASLPFAVGLRSCVGKKLAQYELQKMIAEIVKNFRLTIINKKEIKPILKMITVPSEPLRIKFEAIK